MTDLRTLVAQAAGLLRAGDDVGAKAALNAALKLAPNNAKDWRLRGAALQALDRQNEALECYRRGLALRPGDVELTCDCGGALQALGRADEALACFDEALARSPGHRGAARGRAVILYNQCLPLLAAHEFQRGFALHEQRWGAGVITSLNHARGQRAWRGEALTGVLRIWPEQGVGDEILHARLIGMALKRTPRVVLECDARLVPLFRRSFPSLEEVRAVTDATAFADVEAQCSLTSLAFALGAQREDVEGQGALLQADALRSAALRAKYRALAKGAQIVGIAWRSSNARLGAAKSSDLADWGALLRRSALFVNLQYGETSAEVAAARAAFGCTIFDDPEIDQMSEPDGFAAQIGALDHVVSVSNTTVHMAGALGRDCTVVLPSDRRALWYWGEAGETTPWYASLKLVAFDEQGGRAGQIARAAEIASSAWSAGAKS